MARVITPAGLDLGDVQDPVLIAYYRGERYTFPDDAVETEPTSLDLTKPPADVAVPVVSGAAPTVAATAGALPGDETGVVTS